MEVGDGGSFLRQLSHGGGGGGGWEHSSSLTSSYYLSSSNGHGGSKRWGRGKKAKRMEEGGRGGSLEGGGGMMAVKKRVMVVIDQSSRAKHAMMWALTHVANKGDLLTLLHVVPSHSNASSTHRTDDIPQLANSLGSLCKACKSEVKFFFLLVFSIFIIIIVIIIYFSFCGFIKIGGGGGTGYTRTKVGNSAEPSEETRGFCAGVEPGQAITYLLVSNHAKPLLSFFQCKCHFLFRSI